MTGLRPAGFASAAMANGDDMAVYTWCGKVVSGPDPAVIELQRTGSTWRSFDLSASPLFRLRVWMVAHHRGRIPRRWRLVAGIFSRRRCLREGSTWTLLFTNANSPVGYPIRTMVVDGAGGLWMEHGGERSVSRWRLAYEYDCAPADHSALHRVAGAP